MTGVQWCATACASCWWSRSRCCRRPARSSRACWRAARRPGWWTSGTNGATGRCRRGCGPSWTASVSTRRLIPKGFRAGRTSGRRWRWPLRWSPTCCCWTSPPTISTSRPSRRLRPLSTQGRRPSSSRTTGASSIRWPPASSSWIAGWCAVSPATSPPTRRCVASSWKPRRWPTASSTSSGRRKRSGSARASRRAAHATKVACGGWKRCARRGPPGASAPARSAWRWMRANAPASWSARPARPASAWAGAAWCATWISPSCAVTASA